MQRIKMTVKKKTASTKFPIKENQFINLDKLAKFLEQNGFDFTYNADFGFNSIYIKFENVCFSVFANGRCTSLGSLSLQKQNELVNELWQDLRKFTQKY